MLRGDDMTVAVTLEVFADLCSVSYPSVTFRVPKYPVQVFNFFFVLLMQFCSFGGLLIVM